MATTTMTTDSITRRFAVACGVLSQYVKAAAPPPASSGAMALMGAPAAVVQEPNAQQLTIFYGGRVLVLDGCTPARAAELIRYAAAAAAPTAAKGSAEPALVDMPIARKASLKRFLAKRKDRAVAAARAPYFRTEEAPAKKTKAEATSEEPSTWLALGSLGDMHAARAVIASTSHCDLGALC